ncbi:uncharacterized protein LOC132639692 [Lycium barbarum]|uniref:uncharacterized protein LOC132639692 n=1 Tax=Lycium barbarum TaxID=112863 RepID=UPI00293E28D3|nr:uncharacterized protein LOC132639692 [Lycium barbarum]
MTRLIPPTWYGIGATKFLDYLNHGKLPEVPKALRALQAKAVWYCVVDGLLHRRCFFSPMARCVGPEETDYVIRAVHEGICGNHSGVESLSLRSYSGPDINGPEWRKMRRPSSGDVTNASDMLRCCTSQAKNCSQLYPIGHS